MRSPLTWGCIAIFFLTGCASTNNIAPTSTLITAQNLNLAKTQNSSHSISPYWWHTFNDPQLDSLVSYALKSAPTLKQAAARVRAAQSVVGEANALNGPNLDVNGSVNRQRTPKNVFQAIGYPASPIYSTTNALNLNLAYELDWWGKFHNQVNAAKAQVNAAIAEQDQATLTLSSNLVSTYYTLQMYYELEKLLQQQVENSENLTQLYQYQYRAGLLSSDTPQQTRAQSDGVKQQLLNAQTIISILKNQLAALCGNTPSATENLHPVPLPDAQLIAPKVELTTDLLGKRPDITAQRQLVESYSQQVKAARKDFYPSLSISALAGFTTTNINSNSPNFFDSGSFGWGIAPAISLPIFHAGALRSALGEKSAQYDQAVESYNQTVLNAIQEVADVLTLQKNISQQLQQAQSATHAMRKVYRVNSARYHAGTIGRDQLLSAQSQLLKQQQAELNTYSNLIQANLALIRVLGGGYQAPTLPESYS